MSHLIRGSERMYSCNKSSIYRGVWDGHDIAIKHIPRRFCVMDNMGKSVESKFLQVMQDCNRVVRHIDTIYEEDDIYIVMDWVRGRDMRRHMQMMTGPLSEIRVRDIVFQVAIFLKACNRKGLVYADTKLENIMIEPTGGTKIIDFGCTRSIHNAPMCYMGTPLYFSPEMFDMVLSPSHDVWGPGRGCLLHRLWQPPLPDGGVIPYQGHLPHPQQHPGVAPTFPAACVVGVVGGWQGPYQGHAAEGPCHAPYHG